MSRQGFHARHGGLGLPGGHFNGTTLFRRPIPKGIIPTCNGSLWQSLHADFHASDRFPGKRRSFPEAKSRDPKDPLAVADQRPAVSFPSRKMVRGEEITELHRSGHPSREKPVAGYALPKVERRMDLVLVHPDRPWILRFIRW